MTQTALYILLGYSLLRTGVAYDVPRKTTPFGVNPNRILQPPFPDGLCGGKLVRIPWHQLVSRNQVLLPKRSLDVWLPPDYASSARHPVLLCHDGQNAMTDASSWTGASWRLTGALTRLMEHNALRTPAPVVVMIASAEGDLVPGVRRRHLEYAGDGPFADAHGDLLVTKVLPMIEQRFSTSHSEVYAMGSSLGGQASMQLLLRYPDVFAGAACLSPYFQPSTLNLARTKAQQLRSKRLYFDIGGDMGGNKVPVFDLLDHLTTEHWWNPGYWWLDSQLQPGVETMTNALQAADIPYLYHKEPGGRHNERAWAQRIDIPLMHLFGKDEMSGKPLAP